MQFGEFSCLELQYIDWPLLLNQLLKIDMFDNVVISHCRFSTDNFTWMARLGLYASRGLLIFLPLETSRIISFMHGYYMLIICSHTQRCGVFYVIWICWLSEFLRSQAMSVACSCHFWPWEILQIFLLGGRVKSVSIIRTSKSAFFSCIWYGDGVLICDLFFL